MLGSSTHDDGIEDETTTGSGMVAISPANKARATASSNSSSLNGSVATVSAAAQQRIEEEIIAEEIRLA